MMTMIEIPDKFLGQTLRYMQYVLFILSYLVYSG